MPGRAISNYELRITNYEFRLSSFFRSSLWVLLIAAFALSGCQPAPASQPGGAATPVDATLPNAPAVVEPTATLVATATSADKPQLTATSSSVGEAVGTATGTATGAELASPAAPSGESLAAPSPDPGDTGSWPLHAATLEGVHYNYRYPPEWSSGLTYCAPGADKSEAEGGHLPAGCVSTDILVGQKARDVGQLSGESLTIDGKRAVRQIETEPANVLVSRIYTLLVYGNDGAPLFGFSAMIGANTDRATQEAITSTLDSIANTLKVWSEK